MSLHALPPFLGSALLLDLDGTLLDIAAVPDLDRKGKTCNALSGAVSFSGSPATLGMLRGVVQEASDCPGFSDKCDP